MAKTLTQTEINIMNQVMTNTGNLIITANS